jgi:site-specific DNA-methyltransferase (adenine-specific)/adenine-specific DNA-methyltransferase
MNDEQRQELVRRLQQGEELSPEWARILFPPEKREYELVYYGKEREEDILANTLAVPLQKVRTFGKNGDDWHNMLIFGDNLQVMKNLLDRKKSGKLRNADGTDGVRLVYIDPPFATKQDFRGSQDQKAYQDKIVGAEFVEFLRKRLVFLRNLLADDGAIYLHLDYRKVHYVKALIDEIFGESKFVNEIIWQRTASHNDPGRYGCVHDTLLFYKAGSAYVWNESKMEQSQEYIDTFFVYAESPDKKRHVRIKKGEEAPRGWERYRLGNFASPHPRPNLTYEYKGYKPPKNGWKVDPKRMREMDQLGLLHFPSSKDGRIQPKQYLKDTLGNKAVSDVWIGIHPLQATSSEKQFYPTQKPEALLDRIIRASSKEGDIVLDAFAGSGTACAVAEKLGRRWVGIDCGKLAIYAIQKRMLNLHKDIGEKGAALTPKPFGLYNAGLYDFSKLKELQWDAWRFFALQLFQCRDEPHKIGGIQLDGYLKGSSVLVFNHQNQPGVRIDEDTIQSIHEALGSKVGSRMFIVAPALVFDFQQDYLTLDGVRYYALRIPYSIIHELHQREFAALKQPADELAVNDTVDAVGFDFVRRPELKYEAGKNKRKGELFEEGFIKIQTFKSEAIVREPMLKRGNRETLSMVMLDYDFDSETDVFAFDAVYYAEAIEQANWEVRFPLEFVGAQVMVVFIDIYGNEAREVIPGKTFGLREAKPAKKRP